MLKNVKSSSRIFKNFKRKISNYNIQNFDKRLFTNYYNYPNYDKYQTIILDKHIFKSQITAEQLNARKLNVVLDYNLLNEVTDEVFGRSDPRVEEYPEKVGSFYYTTKVVSRKGDAYYSLFRSESFNGKMQLVFDPKVDQVIPKKYLDTHMINGMSIDDSEWNIAVIIDVKNDELPTCFIKNLKNEKVNFIKLRNCEQAEFTEAGVDGNPYGVLFVQKDPNSFRSSKLMYHDLSDTFSEKYPIEIHYDSDESVWLNIEVSKCKNYFHMIRVAKGFSEHLIANRKGLGKDSIAEDLVFKKVANKDDQVIELKMNKIGVLVQYYNNDIAFITHEEWKRGFENLDEEKSFSENFKAKKIFDGVSEIGSDLIGDSFSISEIDFFEQMILIYGSSISKARIFQIDLDEQFLEFINQEEEGDLDIKEVTFEDNQYGSISPGTNTTENLEDIRLHFDSPFAYNEVYSYNALSNQFNILSNFETNGKQFDRNFYEISTVYAPTKDGIRVPVTLIHRKGVINWSKKDIYNFSYKGPEKKLLLKSYGCYGMNLDLDFDLVDWSLLERDWIIAFAHIRGGSEMGQSWHEDAIKEKKLNSVFDLIACANFLIAEGFTHQSLLCGSSNSAGCTIMASAMNFKPNLFKAVSLTAPFLDLSTSLMDPDLPLSVSDYAEFGNPLENELDFVTVNSLCPYKNLQEGQEYPAVLIEAYDKDYRTPLSNILKYTAKFRDLVAVPQKVKPFSDKNIVLRIGEGSHKGSGSGNQGLQDAVDVGVFFEWVIESYSLDLEIEG